MAFMLGNRVVLMMKWPVSSCQEPLTPVQLAQPLSMPTRVKPRSLRRRSVSSGHPHDASAGGVGGPQRGGAAVVALVPAVDDAVDLALDEGLRHVREHRLHQLRGQRSQQQQPAGWGGAGLTGAASRSTSASRGWAP